MLWTLLNANFAIVETKRSLGCQGPVNSVLRRKVSFYPGNRSAQLQYGYRKSSDRVAHFTAAS